MKKLLFDNAKYNDWKNTHNFDNCKLDRKDYGQFLANYITGEHDGFVLNLNASWGAGKTEFLKRMYIELLSRKHPCIYIDAWESDFSKDPLTVVTSELIKQLKLFNFDRNGEQAGRRLNEFFSKALKGTAIGAAGALTKYVLDDGTVGVTTMQEWLNEKPAKFIDKITQEYHEQVDAIKEIRANLSSLANVLNTTYKAEIPVVVLVDELDRCRPTYAIEMLEVIKHFFNTENFVFVVATDTEQLSRSIRAVYGTDFDSKNYLKRFFDRKSNLPTPDIAEYLNACDYDYTEYSCLALYPKISVDLKSSINSTVKHLAMAYDLNIRDIDQLMSKFHSCLREAKVTFENTTKKQYINFIALLVGLIEQDQPNSVYSKRTKLFSPVQEIKNSEFKIAHDFTLGDFIRTSMESITYKEITEEAFGRTHYYKRLPNRNDYSYKLDARSSEEFNTFIMEIINYNQNGNESGHHKFWNWDDMKRVIELAGTLE